MGQSACWACGAECPAKQPAVAGWFTRWTRVGLGGRPVMECYCPPCWGRWGWPPETVYRCKEHGDRRPAACGPGPPRVYRLVGAGGRRRGRRDEE